MSGVFEQILERAGRTRTRALPQTVESQEELSERVRELEARQLTERIERACSILERRRDHIWWIHARGRNLDNLRTTAREHAKVARWLKAVPPERQERSRC
jgi:hypothetical protein